MSKELVKEKLQNWVDELTTSSDALQAEVLAKESTISNYQVVRNDLQALIDYMDTAGLPDPVYRAIELCLQWNPHVAKKAEKKV